MSNAEKLREDLQPESVLALGDLAVVRPTYTSSGPRPVSPSRLGGPEHIIYFSQPADPTKSGDVHALPGDEYLVD